MSKNANQTKINYQNKNKQTLNNKGNNFRWHKNFSETENFARAKYFHKKMHWLEIFLITSNTIVKSIAARLDKLYKKDDTLSKSHALESFETYKQPSTLSISECINEFEKSLPEVKNYGTEMSDDILAYRLLKNVNLKQSKEHLIKATISVLSYNLMKEQLKDIQ